MSIEEHLPESTIAKVEAKKLYDLQYFIGGDPIRRCGRKCCSS
jgi:hypothetical protein